MLGRNTGDNDLVFLLGKTKLPPLLGEHLISATVRKCNFCATRTSPHAKKCQELVTAHWSQQKLYVVKTSRRKTVNTRCAWEYAGNRKGLRPHSTKASGKSSLIKKRNYFPSCSKKGKRKLGQGNRYIEVFRYYSDYERTIELSRYISTSRYTQAWSRQAMLSILLMRDSKKLDKNIRI